MAVLAGILPLLASFASLTFLCVSCLSLPLLPPWYLFASVAPSRGLPLGWVCFLLLSCLSYLSILRLLYFLFSLGSLTNLFSLASRLRYLLLPSLSCCSLDRLFSLPLSYIPLALNSLAGLCLHYLVRLHLIVFGNPCLSLSAHACFSCLSGLPYSLSPSFHYFSTSVKLFLQVLPVCENSKSPLRQIWLHMYHPYSYMSVITQSLPYHRYGYHPYSCMSMITQRRFK